MERVPERGRRGPNGRSPRLHTTHVTSVALGNSCSGPRHRKRARPLHLYEYRQCGILPLLVRGGVRVCVWTSASTLRTVPHRSRLPRVPGEPEDPLNPMCPMTPTARSELGSDPHVDWVDRSRAPWKPTRTPRDLPPGHHRPRRGPTPTRGPRTLAGQCDDTRAHTTYRCVVGKSRDLFVNRCRVTTGQRQTSLPLTPVTTVSPHLEYQ